MPARAIDPVLITAYVCVGTLQHANLRWTFGPLGRVLVSPAYHRLHHATDIQDVNLGVVLTIWDVLAGRARFPSRASRVGRTGLDGRPVPVEQDGPARAAPAAPGRPAHRALPGVEVVLPRTVIAQIWRGSPRQANVGRLISAGRTGGGPVIIDELTADRAKQIGVTIGATSHPDIADVHVALAAAERGHAVLTSDDGDIAGVNPELILVHV
jgi:hypothetical protein